MKLPISGPPRPGEDAALDAVTDWFLGQIDLEERLGLCLRQSIDEVVDAARTGRWDLGQCDDVEATYLGFKVENVVRSQFDLAYGSAMDYEVEGIDVDCKWTKNFGQWQIPTEAVDQICLLLWADDHTSDFLAGLVRIREEMLVGGNQDKKRTIQSPGGRSRIRWIAPGAPPLDEKQKPLTSAELPVNLLLHLPDADKRAILAHRGGDDRAVEFVKRCDGVIFKRHTVEAISRQLDPTRRFRGESRKALAAEGFEILNGHWADQKQRATELGGPVPANKSEWVCLRTDGSSAACATRRAAASTT